VLPVLAYSSLPSATVSPAEATPRFSLDWPSSLKVPDTRPTSRSGDRSVMPSPTCPESTRTTDILPAWPVLKVLST
jgi:hypothetical protein